MQTVRIEFENEREAFALASDVWLEDPEETGRPEDVAVLCTAREAPDAGSLARLIYDATFRYAHYTDVRDWDTQSDEAWSASQTRAREAPWPQRTCTREAVREVLARRGWSRTGTGLDVQIRGDRIEVRRPVHDDTWTRYRAAHTVLSLPYEAHERHTLDEDERHEGGLHGDREHNDGGDRRVALEGKRPSPARPPSYRGLRGRCGLRPVAEPRARIPPKRTGNSTKPPSPP